jgi:formylmethanofuran dehydrogenase subunit E
MALKGLSLLGLSPDDDLRDLMIFLESDRCMADAVYVVTGITLGRRRLKLLDLGKAAMTFLDLKSGKAFRVAASSKIRPRRDQEDLPSFWGAYGDDEILSYREAKVRLRPEDLPGRPTRRVTCQECGEDVLDNKDILVDGKTLCLTCAGMSHHGFIIEA